MPASGHKILALRCKPAAFARCLQSALSFQHRILLCRKARWRNCLYLQCQAVLRRLHQSPRSRSANSPDRHSGENPLPRPADTRARKSLPHCPDQDRLPQLQTDISARNPLKKEKNFRSHPQCLRCPALSCHEVLRCSSTLDFQFSF